MWLRTYAKFHYKLAAQNTKLGLGFRSSRCYSTGERGGKTFAALWGNGDFGRLGLGTVNSQWKPVVCSAFNGDSLRSIACGGAHSLFLTGNGELYTWGSNENGCLGIGRTDVIHSPERVDGPFLRLSVNKVSCGWKHTAVISDGHIFTWGWGGSHGTFSVDGQSSGGQLGHGNDVDYIEPMMVDFGSDVKALQVSCGFNHTDVGDSIGAKGRGQVQIPSLGTLTRWQWWILVGLNVFFLVAGQTAAVLLGRFYYDQGGASTFMATLVQTAGFPTLFIPLFFLPSSIRSSASSTPSNSISGKYICLIYIALGILLAADNLLYSEGLLYLSASTYSLICATQLAFNAVFAFFINSQKFTPLILNSVVILTYSAALLGFNESSDEPAGVSKSQYAIGFICTLGASAIYSLLLSLMQLTFQKALKKETFSVVLEMQIYTSIVASIASVVGLFASGQWSTLGEEMHGFHTGKVSYVMTLVWTAICWQVCSVGVVGLIFLVSSLFSNVISTVALAVGPIAAVVAFRDKMDGVKVIAMLQAIWGFVSYIYQNYLDESKLRESERETNATEGQAARC